MTEQTERIVTCKCGTTYTVYGESASWGRCVHCFREYDQPLNDSEEELETRAMLARVFNKGSTFEAEVSR